jgi:hypothetical protein
VGEFWYMVENVGRSDSACLIPATLFRMFCSEEDTDGEVLGFAMGESNCPTPLEEAFPNSSKLRVEGEVQRVEVVSIDHYA